MIHPMNNEAKIKKEGATDTSRVRQSYRQAPLSLTRDAARLHQTGSPANKIRRAEKWERTTRF